MALGKESWVEVTLLPPHVVVERIALKALDELIIPEAGCSNIILFPSCLFSASTGGATFGRA